MGKICITTLIKSQYRQLREWIDFHKLVGVDHFFLCQDVGSIMGFDLVRRLLADYIAEGTVTLYDARTLFSETAPYRSRPIARPFYDLVLRQLKAMADQGGYTWQICADVDDFFVPIAHGTLPRFLERFNPSEITGIMLSGKLFGFGNAEDIPLYNPESIVDSCRSVLFNKNEIKSISSIESSTGMHVHHPIGTKPLVNPEGKVTDFLKPVESYKLAFHAYYVQPSLERLNNMWLHASLYYADTKSANAQRARRDISVNRYTNNEWINWPNKDHFDPNVTSDEVINLYNLRKQGLLPPEPVIEPEPEVIVSAPEPETSSAEAETVPASETTETSESVPPAEQSSESESSEADTVEPASEPS
jgi:hypothetical protein